MADPPKFDKQSRYTEGRGIAGRFEGETVTRRRFMEGTALAAGGIATAAFALPALGFALGPVFEDTSLENWQAVGPENDFNDETYVPRVINIVPEIGDAGKTTVYIRRFDPARDDKRNEDQPYVAISTRCAHLGLPGPLHPGIAEVRLPLPRRRLRIPGRGRGRPAGAAARPLLHPRA